MDKLITSSDPFLALAGAAFLIGAGFDLIFSREFKRRIRRSIIAYGPKKQPFSQLITIYTTYFTSEILAHKSPLAFVLRTVSLCLLIFVVVLILESGLYGPEVAAINVELVGDIARVSGPIIILLFVHVIFDILSAFISVLYFRLVEACKKLSDIILVFVANIVTAAVMWNLFFGYALALHVKATDFTPREALVGLQFSKDVPESWPTPKNSTFRRGDMLVIDFYSSIGGEQLPWRGLRPPSIYNIGLIASNITDTDKTVGYLGRVASYAYPSVTFQNVEKLDTDYYAATLSVERLLGFSKLPWVAAVTYDLVNPLRIAFGRGYSYLSSQQIFFNLILSSGALVWLEDDPILACDNTIRRLKTSEFSDFNFSTCAEYLLAPAEGLFYMALLASMNVPDHHFSYRAFFWSSMAMTVCFYLIFGFLLAWRVTRDFVAAQVANNIFDSERVFFSPFCTCISLVLIVVYCLRLVI
jgi:hypothetical protein